MGLWDETCGLTNTPIHRGRRCVVVLLDPSVERDGLRMGWSFAEQVISIHRGRYSGYGSIEGVELDRDKAAAILFHEHAWDACVGRVDRHDASSAVSSSVLVRTKYPKPGRKAARGRSAGCIASHSASVQASTA